MVFLFLAGYIFQVLALQGWFPVVFPCNVLLSVKNTHLNLYAQIYLLKKEKTGRNQDVSAKITRFLRKCGRKSGQFLTFASF